MGGRGGRPPAPPPRRRGGKRFGPGGGPIRNTTALGGEERPSGGTRGITAGAGASGSGGGRRQECTRGAPSARERGRKNGRQRRRTEQMRRVGVVVGRGSGSQPGRPRETLSFASPPPPPASLHRHARVPPALLLLSLTFRRPPPPGAESRPRAPTAPRQVPGTVVTPGGGRGGDREPQRAAVSPQTAARGRPVSPSGPAREPAPTAGPRLPPTTANATSPPRPPPPTAVKNRGWGGWGRVDGATGGRTGPTAVTPRSSANGTSSPKRALRGIGSELRGTKALGRGRAAAGSPFPRTGRGGATRDRTRPGACDAPAAPPAEGTAAGLLTALHRQGRRAARVPPPTASAGTIDLQATLRQA